MRFRKMKRWWGIAIYRYIVIYIKLMRTQGKPKRIKDVAKTVGVAPITLRRWLLAGKVPEVSRDRNGWRLFTGDEEASIRHYALRTMPPRTRGNRE